MKRFKKGIWGHPRLGQKAIGYIEKRGTGKQLVVLFLLE